MKFFTRFSSYLLPLITIIFYSINLNAQQDESWKIYDESQLARVDITIDPDTLAWIYQNVLSDLEHYASFHFQNAYINESVDSIGFRLRGNTSRYSQKKSFKVSFNTFIKGRDFYGVEKLNLNGEHNDPSIIRSKLCFDQFKNIGVKASRANHVEVYINGQYYGLYISIEHVDEEFLKKYFQDDSGNLWKCLYPADLNYLGTDPDLYKNLIIDDIPVYELKTNESENDFSSLAHLIDILNNTDLQYLPDSLEKILDITGVLQYFAINILTGSWDDYWSLMNNYYLYHEPSKNIFHIIPYDYDNTYGIDWFNIDWANVNPYNFPKVNDGYRPLAERLMQVPQYQNLYTHFLEFYRQNVFILDNWRNRIDSIKLKITQSVLSDTFRTKDYGFNDGDFFNSYSETGYSNQHVKYGLKQFINTRTNSISAQLSYKSASPIVYEIEYEPRNPKTTDSIYIYASAFDNDGLNEVSVQLYKDGSQAIEEYPMSYQPLLYTKKVEESDRWMAVVPPLGEGKTGKFFIYVKDNQNQPDTFPHTNGIEIKTAQDISNDIVINEFMADNATTITDPAGEYDDWIELYNHTSNPILLTGRYLTDKSDNLSKYQISVPDLYLNPNQYLVIWCDEQESQEGIHTNFKLSKSGEYIALIETDGVSIIDSISFDQQTTDMTYGRLPDGDNFWTTMIPTPGNSNNITSVDEKIIPAEFNMSAYPNPFNPNTTIRFTIPYQSLTSVSLKIFDILGNEIRSLVNEERPAGTNEIIWDGKNDAGLKVSSGIYLLKLQFNQLYRNVKLILLK